MKKQFEVFLNGQWIGWAKATNPKAAARACAREKDIRLTSTLEGVKVYDTITGQLSFESDAGKEKV